VFKIFYSSIVFIIMLTAAGCVTTNKPFAANQDKNKAHDTHLSLGLTYLQRDNREASRRHFQKALALKPNSPSALNGLALLYQLTGEMALAEQTFKRSLKSDANFTEARVNYGRFLYEQERYTEAYGFFAEGAKDLVFKKRALVLTYLGQTALELGDVVRARSSFEHAVNLNNKLALPMIELGDLYFNQKDYAQSKQYLDQYNTLAGRSARSLWLGIRIERIFGNKDKEASYSLALKNLHPYSQEYLEYKKERQSSK
jgi:type IV pilus assembly protein PilF